MGWTVYNSDGKILQSAELGDNAVTSAKIADGAIVNADINASAVIAYSKLAALADGNILVGNGSNVATSVNPSGDVNVVNDGTFSISTGVIVNADVNTSAAIALTKLATTTASRLLVSDGSGVITPSSVTTTNLTDLTDSGATTLHSHAGGGPTEAAQADMEDSGTSNADRYVSPEVIKYHPGVAKGWIDFNGQNTPTKRTGYNDDGTIDDNGTGDYSINWSTAFSTSTYAVVAEAGMDGSMYTTIVGGFGNGGYDASEVRIQVTDGDSSFALIDERVINVIAFGDLS